MSELLLSSSVRGFTDYPTAYEYMNGIGLADLTRFSCNPNDLYALVGFELRHQFTCLRWRGHSIRISLSFPSLRLIKLSSVRLNSITIFSSHVEQINKAGIKMHFFFSSLFSFFKNAYPN